MKESYMARKREEPVRKVRKRRKPMTEEQRQAAAERLAKAREARFKNKPPAHVGVAKAVLNLPDDHPLSFNTVREWLKTQKELLEHERRNARNKIQGADAKVASIEGYIKHINAYLSTGDWIDNYYGERREKRMVKVCYALAYNKDGTPKRDKGVFYPDLGYVWGFEDDNS